MAIRLKPTDTIAKKFAARASAAAGDYKDGIANPKRDQSEAAAAAGEAFAAGIQEAIADNRFVKGVRAAGSEKWARKAGSVGAQRYAPGVQAAQPDYAAGAQPYLEVIAGITLPPRFPRGDPRNNERVAAVTTALRRRKVGGG